MNHQALKQKLLENKKFKRAYQQSDIFLDIADNLQTLRIEKGLTQAALAKKVGMHQEAIARLENPGYSVKYLKTLQKIAKALGKRLIAPQFKDVIAEKQQLDCSKRVFNWPTNSSSACNNTWTGTRLKTDTASSYK